MGQAKDTAITVPLRQGFQAAGSSTAAERDAAPHGELYFADRAIMPAHLNDRLEYLVFEHGRSYDSYTVVEPRCHCFFAPDLSGAVCFHSTVAGYHLVGGLFASEADKPALLDAFTAFCAGRRKRFFIYNVDAADIALLRGRDFELTRWGEDPIIDLASSDWRGRPFEWVRRQENFCLRQGLVLREVEVGGDPDWPALRLRLEALSKSHIRRTPHGRELKAFEGRFDLDHFNRRRLFVAELPDGPQGLVVCNPCRGGRRWAFEIYRRGDGAPRGTVAFMFMQIMRRLKAEGVEEVSLSLIPGLNCDQQQEPYSAYFAWVLQFWAKRMNWLFDFRGLFHFKSRFRPRYEARYVAADRHFGGLASVGFVRIWGIFRPNPIALARHVGRHLRKAGARATLATPESD